MKGASDSCVLASSMQATGRENFGNLTLSKAPSIGAHRVRLGKPLGGRKTQGHCK
jgi:hypothetical protein